MRLLDRVLDRLGYVKASEGPSILSAMMAGTGASPRPDVKNMAAYLGRYADQAWVYACIRIIQTKGAGLHLKVYRRGKKAGGVQLTELPDHPLQALLDTANPFMNGYDLREATHGFVELAGNSYWLLDNFVAGKPTEIYPLNPTRIRILADPKKYIIGYVYEINGKEIARYEPWEILHFKTWNPLDDFYGLPPISAARDASDSMLFADRFNKAFFENSAQPGGILSSEQKIPDENIRKRLAESWKQAHQGVRKAHKVAILDGGLKWQSLTSTHSDMQFTELKKMTRADVLTCYGVPPIMLGIDEEASYNNASIQERAFWNNAMIPRLAKIESVLNSYLALPFAEDLVVAHDISGVQALKDDEKLLAEVDEILTRSGIKTINEVREGRKLKPVGWGNTWNAPIGLMPIDEERLPDLDEPEPAEDDDEEEDDEKPEPKKDAAEALQLNGLTTVVKSPEDRAKQLREKTWYGFKASTEAWERRWVPALRRLFTDQEKEVLRKLQDSGFEGAARQARLDGMKSFQKALDVILFDHSEARRVFRKEGRRLMEAVLSDKAGQEARRYGLPAEFTLTNPRVRAWLDSKAFKFADEINLTTEEALRDTLQEAVAAGESIEDVSKRIEDVFDAARGARARTIARTEVISASNQGAMEAYAQSGVVEEKEWVSSRDEVVRDSHRIDGEVRALSLPFSNGLAQPGDVAGPPEQTINCRCTVAPVIKRS